MYAPNPAVTVEQTRTASDPAPNPKLVEEGRPNKTFEFATSDAFFERPENRVRAQGSQWALIDDDHSLAKALQNFENLKALAAPNSIIAIHDVVPMTSMAAPQRRRPRQCSIPATWRLMKMLIEGDWRTAGGGSTIRFQRSGEATAAPHDSAFGTKRT